MNKMLFYCCFSVISAQLNASTLELKQRFKAPIPAAVVLTLDACSGGYDSKLIRFLIAQRIPATLFLTKKWMDENRGAVAELKNHLDLFEIENHGENHVPAILGEHRSIYGLRGARDMIQVRREVDVGAREVEKHFEHPSRWYRGATAHYDPLALNEIVKMGYKVAGFSLNADEGATLPAWEVARRVQNARHGDIILAHMNKPNSGNAKGLAEGLSDLRKRKFTFMRLEKVELFDQ